MTMESGEFFLLDNHETECRIVGKKENTMITVNTRNELTDLLSNTEYHTIVGVVRFGGELLDEVFDGHYNQISIDHELGFCDDGGWIEIDANGNVIEDAYLP
jgi:hypothetical protein